MKKQVAKSQIFTKESLTRIQDKMRTCCIKSFNKVYDKICIQSIIGNGASVGVCFFANNHS